MNMVLTTKVVGLTFNPSYPQNIYAVAKDFALGDDSIILIREKYNEADANAIAVYHGENQIGHVPRKLSEFVSPQIDSGIEWHAAIESVVVSQNNVNNPGLKITMWSSDAD